MNKNRKCEACEQEFPSYLVSDVQIFSREFIGKMAVCDFCYVDSDYKSLRKYKGLYGLTRWVLKKRFVKKFPEKVKLAIEITKERAES